MNMYELQAGLLLALPLAGFVTLSLAGRRLTARVAGVVATLLLGLTALLSWSVALGYFFRFGKVEGVYETCRLMGWDWLPFNESLSIQAGVALTPVSAMMLIVISTVSFLVHLYSIGYMKGEGRMSSYFAYLQLFTFSMLGLVVAFNIFQLYFFWELVGVSSFLLIGFYFTLPAAVAAAKKAFIVTRFADLGFLVGILMLGAGAGTFDIEEMIRRLTTEGSPWLVAVTEPSFLGVPMLTWALLLVFVGGAGKSAVFPLHVWLPDAMEGPTPVSALIHAATMVVAGVFLVARLFPVYAVAAPGALEVIAVLAAFTALFAAVIACTQTELKKVLAYSTISQIAYMLLALGVASWGEAEGYTASLFHLFTHAFFKAALFLCAGVVIHVVHSGKLEDMGGLRRHLPVTHMAFLLAALSISGCPFLSGFFSKEAILSAVWASHPVLYGVALLTSGLTAFYMFRIYFLVFFNKESGVKKEATHESWVMTLPLVVLSVGTVFAGYIPFGEFVSSTGAPMALHVGLVSSILPVSAGVIGVGLATHFYAVQSGRSDIWAARMGGFYQWAYHKFYIDAVYLFFAHRVMDRGFGRFFSFIDRQVVLGSLNGLANDTYAVSRLIRRMQSGRIQTYAFFFLGGVLLMALLLIIQYI